MFGAVATLLLSPLCGDTARLRLKRDWSAALVDAFGVSIEADIRYAKPGCLIVANHISWLDIFVINAVLPSAFVAKDDNGYYFRSLGHRFDGETALDAGGRARQLREEFDRTWERSRPCSEYRALGL